MYDMSVLYSPRKLANCVPDLCARPSRYAHTIPEAVCTVATIESADGGNVVLSILYATRAMSITTSSYRLHRTGVAAHKAAPGSFRASEFHWKKSSELAAIHLICVLV